MPSKPKPSMRGLNVPGPDVAAEAPEPPERVAYVPAGRERRPLALGEPAEFAAPRVLDVLVPACDRPAELAAVLAGLAAQAGAPTFGVVVSDQSTGDPAWCRPAVAGTVRILRRRGHPVLLERHLPRRGPAEQRNFLLGRSAARRMRAGIVPSGAFHPESPTADATLVGARTAAS